jgi:hypothetical protein
MSISDSPVSWYVQAGKSFEPFVGATVTDAIITPPLWKNIYMPMCPMAHWLIQ